MDSYSEYLVVKSASTAFSSVTNKLTDLVNERIEQGWNPLGSAKILFVSEKYLMIQTMVR